MVIGTIPFHLIMFVVLGLVIFWPELALVAAGAHVELMKTRAAPTGS